MNNNYDFWFWLNVTANWCQLESYQMNLEQTSNDELLNHLIKQDKVLDEQTENYLKTIVEQNNTIIKLLKKGEK